MRFECSILCFSLLIFGINCANWFNIYQENSNGHGMMDRPFTCWDNMIEHKMGFKLRVENIEKIWNVHPPVIFNVTDKKTFEPTKCCATYDFVDMALMFGETDCNLSSYETYKYYLYQGKDIVDKHCEFYKYHSEKCELLRIGHHEM